MEINEAIKRYEVMAEYEEKMAYVCENDKERHYLYELQAENHRQLAKRLKELKAYRQAYEDIRHLTISWEEGIGINKCIEIIEKFQRKAGEPNDIN